jgi:hypothetical protein
MTDKVDIIYDLVKSHGKKLDTLIAKHDECATKKEVKVIHKQINTARGYFLGVCGFAGVLVTALKLIN